MTKLKLAVLGSPISHSRSPELHASFGKDYGFVNDNFFYERIEATENELSAMIKKLISEGYDGFNCTMPLKTEIARLADYLGEEARILSSANTVVIRDGKLYADTTDGIGVCRAVCRGYSQSGRGGESARGKQVLLIGAGGAARSAALSLKRAGASLTVCNRTLESAVALSHMISGGCDCIPLSDEDALRSAAMRADILINCSSLGMNGKDDFANFDFLLGMKKGGIVIDAVYNPLETTLLRRAAEMGLQSVSGLWMLVYQGAAAFEKWTGILPDETACERAFEAIK